MCSAVRVLTCRKEKRLVEKMACADALMAYARTDTLFYDRHVDDDVDERDE